MRHLKAYIPEYPVGTAEELADKIAEFLPIARAVLGVKNLKIITFGPRPQDFFACNAPIKGGDDAYLWACNKWLLADPDSADSAQGAVAALTG